MPPAEQVEIVIPDGYKVHTENSARILLPSTHEAFLNPVQEFNRDLSVACIRMWSEDFNREKQRMWNISQEKRLKRKEWNKPPNKRQKSLSLVTVLWFGIDQ